MLMKRIALTAAALAVSLPLFAQNSYPLYLAGDFNGWSASGTVMTDMGGGVWSASVSGLTAGSEYQFQVTDGNWSSWFTPSQHSWLIADASGDATVSIDLNTYADGWTGSSDRITTSVDPGAWTAVGAWNGWNNSDPTAAMTYVGNGIYEVQKTIATAGYWGFKATQTGGWNYQIGADGRNINAAEVTFSTVAPNQQVDMFVNTLNATVKVDVIPVPEPTAIVLIGLGGLFAIRQGIRRR